MVGVCAISKSDDGASAMARLHVAQSACSVCVPKRIQCIDERELEFEQGGIAGGIGRAAHSNAVAQAQPLSVEASV